MTTNHRLDEDAARAQALAWLETFCTRFLPGTLRRIMVWKRLPRHCLAELIDETRQELAVDCLENVWLVVAQPTPARHLRWMRCVERFVYRNWVVRGPTAEVDDDLPARPDPCIAPDLAELWPDQAPPIEQLSNGRMNRARTAERFGTSARALKDWLEQLAERLDLGTEHVAFWRLRLVEALVGLASDLLRDAGVLHLVARKRSRPDPDARRRRLRRLGGYFAVRPSTSRERALLRHWLRNRNLLRARPRALLEHAVALAPHSRAAWLWLFEACMLDGDHRAAAAALRSCRQMAAPSVVASTLARARLAEARHGLAKAERVLARAVGRWPRLGELERVLAGVRAHPRTDRAIG
ncbi:MAG: hypothetical protein JNK15_06460 [Planctomycetes bacterium]|nr:hypothetical protein [Planctomycetota bacterium]